MNIDFVQALRDIEKETVSFRDNFDNSLQEPTVLPARLPMRDGALIPHINPGVDIPINHSRVVGHIRLPLAQGGGDQHGNQDYSPVKG